MLCYHINDTCNTQNIRVMSEAICHFERIVFARERILFEAFPDSYLEVYSFRLEGSRMGTRMSRIACRLLRVNDEPEEFRRMGKATHTHQQGDRHGL